MCKNDRGSLPGKVDAILRVEQWARKDAEVRCCVRRRVGTRTAQGPVKAGPDTLRPGRYPWTAHADLALASSPCRPWRPPACPASAWVPAELEQPHRRVRASTCSRGSPTSMFIARSWHRGVAEGKSRGARLPGDFGRCLCYALKAGSRESALRHHGLIGLW